MKHSLLKYNIKYQLVPPHLRYCNGSKQDFQTFKACLITDLCTSNPNFPVDEWGYLFPQAKIALNILCSFRFNPKLSSYSALNGPFYFSLTPLAPPGTRVLMHKNPKIDAPGHQEELMAETLNCNYRIIDFSSVMYPISSLLAFWITLNIFQQ